MTASILGLDVGGAHLKAAHSGGTVLHQPYELWKDPAGLVDAVRSVLGRVAPLDLLAVTMTGELCDCFRTKQEGVRSILYAVAAAAGRVPIRVWQTDSRLVGLPEARQQPLLAAAANWLALATYCGRYVPEGPGLVID